MYNVAVVIPVYKTPENLNQFEKDSISNCFTKLFDMEIFMVGSESICLAYQQIYSGIKFEHFNPKYFKSISGYNHLLKHPVFYKRFTNYSHMLIVQTDAWIFGNSSDLNKFLHFDYAGAPSFDKGVFRGYNGGLSLRNVSKCLQILKQFKYTNTPNEIISRHTKKQPFYKIILWKWLSILLDLTIRNNFMYPLNRFVADNEDVFWSSMVPARYPDFNVIGYKESIQFSWEHNLEELHASNPLPFGAHGWWNYNPDFWKSIIK